MKKIGGFVAGLLAVLGVAYVVKKKMSYSQKLKAKAWMLKMKGEIVEKAENMRDLTAETYSEVVDAVAKKYEDLKNVNQGDLERFAERLKRKWHWVQKFKEA